MLLNIAPLEERFLLNASELVKLFGVRTVNDSTCAFTRVLAFVKMLHLQAATECFLVEISHGIGLCKVLGIGVNPGGLVVVILRVSGGSSGVFTKYYII